MILLLFCSKPSEIPTFKNSEALYDLGPSDFIFYHSLPHHLFHSSYILENNQSLLFLNISLCALLQGFCIFCSFHLQCSSPRLLKLAPLMTWRSLAQMPFSLEGLMFYPIEKNTIPTTPRWYHLTLYPLLFHCSYTSCYIFNCLLSSPLTQI